jgi:hypothetical protein
MSILESSVSKIKQEVPIKRRASHYRDPHMLRMTSHKPVTRKLMVIAAVLCLWITVGAPNLKRYRRKILVHQAAANLHQIREAKKNFAEVNHRSPESAILDGKDLVPRFMSSWPKSPPDRAAYSANSVGTEPTVNGFTESQIEGDCDRDDKRCIF